MQLAHILFVSSLRNCSTRPVLQCQMPSDARPTRASCAALPYPQLRQWIDAPETIVPILGKAIPMTATFFITYLITTVSRNKT